MTIFVSTKLGVARSVPPDGSYRRLTPEYFSWLSERVKRATKAARMGKVPQEAFEEMTRRWEEVKRLAKEAGLVDEPKPFLFPEDLNPKEYPFTFRVSAHALQQVDAIRDQALSLGWNLEALYQNRGRFRFPLGQDWGLVCFVEPKEHIGRVTEEHIEIIQPAGHALRFYRDTAPKPITGGRP